MTNKSIREQVRAIPRFEIKWLVDRRHVGTPDAEIVAEFEERLKLADPTPYQKRRVIQYALAVHHSNQKLCRDFRL